MTLALRSRFNAVENRGNARTRAIDRLGVPGLKEALDFTGAGNNPAIVKAFARMGRLLSEDRFAPGHSPAPAAQRSPAEIIYGATPRQSSND